MAFEIHKRGQGNPARLVTAFGLLAVVAVGCIELDRRLVREGWRWSVGPLQLRPGTVIAFVLFLGCAAATAWLVLGFQRLVDYLILTEAELRKVIWPSKRDLTQQTVVVIVVSLMLGILILVVDLVFSNVIWKLLT